MTTPKPEGWDQNALIRVATGRGPVTEAEPSTTDETSSNDEPEPELSMNDLIRRAAGRSYEQPDEQPSETTKPKPNDVFNAMIRSHAHSGRQFSFGLPMSTSSDNKTEDAT
jgi:hypothetical protein